MVAPIDVTNVRIETPRLILRPWRMEDLPDLNEYASVPGVGEMAGWSAHKSMEESEAILKLFIEEKKTLALELKESGKVIGSVGLEKAIYEDFRRIFKRGREVGYVLSKAYWGRGLMPEAVKAVMAYCFDTLGYDFLTCSHFLSNTQSRRVIEKCGFRYVRDHFVDTRFGTREHTKTYVCYNPNK